MTQREATRLEAVRQETARRDAARGRDLKAARALALARRVEGHGERARATVADLVRPYLVCACGEDRFGLALERVAQVLPGRAATPVPGADPMVEGLVALSGRIVGVVGLARALGRSAPDPAGGGHLVMLRGEPPVALAVDRAIGIVRTGHGGAEPGSPPGPGLGNGTASDYVPAADGHPDFVIVDPTPLLRRLMP